MPDLDPDDDGLPLTSDDAIALWWGLCSVLAIPVLAVVLLALA